MEETVPENVDGRHCGGLKRGMGENWDEQVFAKKKLYGKCSNT